MVEVQFFGMLRLLLKCERIELPAQEGETIASLLQRTQLQLPVEVMHKLVTDNGELKAGTVILVNRHNIRHLQGLTTPVGADDVVALFPPGAGG